MIAALCLWATTLPATAQATVKVVATIFPLADIVQQVGKAHVEVATLLPPGASPHTFEPTPAQIRAVADARVFVCIGAGLDNWASKLLGARSGPITVVTLTDGVQLLESAEGRGGDPHIWLDPVLIRDHVVPKIVEALVQADAAARPDIEAAATEFRGALTRLDTEIRATLAAAPSRSYVTFHAAWRYFGQRYNLREAAVVEAFPGKEPSAQEIAAVVRAARNAHVHAVLVEPQFTPRAAEQIAREFDAQVLLLDPLGGPNVPGRNRYLDLMRYNSQVFAKALQ